VHPSDPGSVSLDFSGCVQLGASHSKSYFQTLFSTAATDSKKGPCDGGLGFQPKFPGIVARASLKRASRATSAGGKHRRSFDGADSHSGLDPHGIPDGQRVQRRNDALKGRSFDGPLKDEGAANPRRARPPQRGQTTGGLSPLDPLVKKSAMRWAARQETRPRKCSQGGFDKGAVSESLQRP